MKEPNKLKNAIIEKTKQAMDGASRKSASTSLDKVRSQNQVGQRIQQTRSPPPKFAQDPNLKEKYTIFDKWVEFRDKYLAGNVNEGFRKVGYTGKFMVNSLLNSNMANNLKQKAVDEASNIKNKAQSGELFSFSSNKQDNENATSAGSNFWKNTVREKLGQGAEFAKEKAQEAYVYGKEVGTEQLSKGAEVAKEKLGQGAEIAKEKAKEAFVFGKEVGTEQLNKGAEVAKEKLGQGAEIAKEKAKEAFVFGKEVGTERLSKGAEVAKDKLSQGAEIAKEKFGYGAEIAKEKAKEAYVYGKEVGAEQLSKGADIAKEKLGQGAGVAKEKLGQGAQVIKDKLKEEYSHRSSSFKGQAENLSNYSKESLKSATENVSKSASSAYDSVKSAPDMVANKVWKIGKRAGILFFAGATVVAFAYAAGRQLPIAYFNYQLKKQQKDNQGERLEERPVTNERNVQ